MDIFVFIMNELTVLFVRDQIARTRSLAPLLPVHTRNSWLLDDVPVSTAEAFPARERISAAVLFPDASCMGIFDAGKAYP